MEIQNNNNISNSEIISPENNYKFDNYGIVMADSIEDLLYDKYHYRKKKYNKDNKEEYNSNDNSSDVIDKVFSNHSK